MNLRLYKGIIANIPTTLQDGKHVGRKLREDLAKGSVMTRKSMESETVVSECCFPMIKLVNIIY
ncbi:hypothetical protein J1N35_024477 [Gossypium stocksii]|uniref:Uncharacterized protein n=1 Tax=Gossypium stocksii TaxID=47602 RepID=A0A9D3V4R7_9ROSI|nr:hypothetical protein J1N35_024477 [Gossypium stocksii]